MTWDEFMATVLALFPNALIDEVECEIIIHTGLMRDSSVDEVIELPRLDPPEG